MQSINESAVWERVTAASHSGDGPASPAAPIGPELLSALEREQESIRRYQALLPRVGGEEQRILREVLQLSRQQYRDLSALCYFLTGSHPALSPAAPVKTARQPLRETLRSMLQREELSLGRLESLAGRSTGEARETLLASARQDHRQFRLLLSLLGRALDG